MIKSKRGVRTAELLGALALMLAGAGYAATAAAAVPDPAPAESPAQTAEDARIKRILDEITPRWGDIPLPAAQAVLHLDKDYYFLDPADARKVIVDGWGNPPNMADGVLGLVFATGTTFASGQWGAVVTYEKTFYVSDADAKSANYDSVLSAVRDSEAADNEARAKEGFEPIHLVGWAQPPQYNAQDHYLVWARDLKFGDQTDDTLNYDVRLLGRRGVLSLNMVDRMSQLASVRSDAEGLAKVAKFEPGSRYADYDKDTDKKASYGLAGLVAAGVGVAAAKKIGFLAVAALFLKKGVVVILALLAGVGGWFKRTFSRKKPPPALPIEPPEPPPSESDPQAPA